MKDLNSLQSTIQDLKEIVQRNQGPNHESALVVRQLEMIVADMERKTKKQSGSVVMPPIQTVPVV